MVPSSTGTVLSTAAQSTLTNTSLGSNMVKEREAATHQENNSMNATAEIQQNAAESKTRSLSSTDDNSMVITSESDQMKSFPSPNDLTQTLKNENVLELNGTPLHGLEDQGVKHGHGHDKESRQTDIHHHDEMDESPAPQYAKDMETDHETRHPSDDKYRRLKRKLKQVLEENERLSIELDRSSRRARTLRSEKNLLLDRLCVYERDSDSSPDTLSSLSSDSELSDAPLDHYHNRSRRVSPEEATTVSHSSKKSRASGNSNNSNKEPELMSSSSVHHPKKTTSKAAGGKSPAAVVRKEGKAAAPAPTPVASTITTVGSATQKPKRITNSLKQRTHSTKARKVQVLEKDETGKVKLPVTVGIITIMDLGHVVYDREAFHNERYIWPVGYKMSRLYNSMIDLQKQTTYTCSIVDDGDAPKFQIDAEDQPGLPIIAGTATGAWTHVVKAANLIRKRDHSNSASGPDYFGFSNATIAKMIQDLPNAEKCENYIMQRFEEPSTKTPFNTSEKRKISALNSLTSEKEGAGEDEEDQEEGIGAEGEEEDDAYTSLGNSEKKTEHTLSSTTRRAGFGLDTNAADDQVGEGGDLEGEKMEEEMEEEEVYELEEEEEEEMHSEKTTSIDAAKEQSQGQEVDTLAAPDDAVLAMTTRDKPAKDEKQEISENEMVDI